LIRMYCRHTSSAWGEKFAAIRAWDITCDE
jgi:hypothetical protein